MLQQRPLFNVLAGQGLGGSGPFTSVALIVDNALNFLISCYLGQAERWDKPYA